MGISQTPQALVPAAFSSGGMTLISTTTLTGSSVSLSSIPQTYKDLRLIVRKFQPSVNAENMSMRVNGVTTANTYRYFDWSTTSTNLRNQSFNQSLRETVAFIDQKSTSEDTNLCDIVIPDYTNTTTWKMYWGYSVAIRNDNSANLSATTRIGFHNQTAAITSISLFPNSGNFTSGTAYLYGVS